MFVARAWRVRTRPMGTQCLCVVGILSVARSRICADKHSVPTGRPPDVERLLQTFRPSGTILCALRLCYKHSVPTGRSPDVERIFYNHSVPLGRFPRPYDCATNVPSLWDGFLRSMIVLHIWSRWDRLVRRTAYCLKLKFGGHPYEV